MKLSGYSRIMAGAAVGALLVYGGPAFADMAAAQKWVDSEFQPSTLSKEEQMKEMEWFIKAAEPFRGMEIKVVSETIPTHEYEVEDSDQGVRGDHRDQGHPRPDPGR